MFWKTQNKDHHC